VSGPQLSETQRLLTLEFERRGWEYDMNVGRSLAEAIAQDEEVDLSQVADLVPRGFLTKSGASRTDVRDAIATVVDGLKERRRRLAVNGAPGLRVLFVAAGPDDEARLRLDDEHRDIRHRIRSSSARDQVVLESALAARPTDLIDELNQHKPTVLHLAGHGGPTGIALQNEAGIAVDVTTDQLSRLVAAADASLRLVVLNSCESSHQAEPIAKHVDAAIGMTREIGDDAARVFASQLYASLAEGVPLDRAFEQARLQISLAGLGEDKTPQLFLRSGVVASQFAFTS